VHREHSDPASRPLPSFQRCRGIPLGDGKYTGCDYGSGKMIPLTGPCDCPVCKGSGVEGVIATVLPHSSFGSPDCDGCLNGIVRGDQADIICNGCYAIVRKVSASELERTFTEMELSLDFASAVCPHCGAIHLAPGFSELMAFLCDNCGELVKLSDDPNIDRVFGS
jgi:hypothetical protein